MLFTLLLPSDRNIFPSINSEQTVSLFKSLPFDIARVSLRLRLIKIH